MCGWLAVGIVIVLLPIWSDTEWIKEPVMEQLTALAGGPIQMETLKLHVFPSPTLYVENVSFEANEPGSMKFGAKQVEVKIGWRSLWNKQFVITHLSLDQPEITIEASSTESTDVPPLEDIPEIQELVVRDGRLHLLRTVATQTTQAMNWENIQLDLLQRQTQGLSQFSLSGQIPNTQPSSLNINGTFTLREPHAISSLDKDVTPMASREIHGQIEGSHFNLGQLVHFFSGQALDPPLHTEANVRGTFSYILQKEKDVLEFDNFHLSLNDWTLTGQASVTNLFQASSRLDLSGSTTPLAIEQLSSLLPSEWIPDDIQTFLSDHHVVGTVELQRGTFHIPLNDKEVAEAQGIIRVENGQFLPAVGQPLLSTISGTVTFSPSTIQFSQVQGHMTPLTITTPEATLAFEEETVRLSVPTFQISEDDWIFNGTVGFTNAVHEPPTLTISGSAPPLSIQHLTTRIPEIWLPDSVSTLLTERAIDGMMELLTGSFQWKGDDANTVTSEGVIRVTNGHVLIDSNHPPLTHLSGGIVFESNLVRLVDVKGTIAASKIALQEATLEWKDSDVWVDLHGNGLFSAHDVYQALLRDSRSTPLLESLSLYHDAQGQLGISTHIQGPLSNPAELHVLQGNLWLENLHLFPVLNGLAAQQINGQFSFDDQGIRIKSFKGQLGESPVEIRGQWSFRKDSQASNATIASRLSSNDFKTLLPSIGKNFSILKGPIDLTMTLSGSSLRPTYQGTIDLTNADLIAKDLFQKSSGVPATIDLKGFLVGNAIRLTKGILSIPPYTLDAQGQWSWTDPPSIRGFFQTESGTGAMFPQGVIIGDGRLSLSSLGITWGFEGKNWDWTTWSMKGKIEGSNRSTESTTSHTKDDVQSASFQWVQKNQKGKGELILKGIPIESLLAPRSTNPPPVTGTTSMTTALHMKMESPEQLQASLTGKGTVQLQKGLIQTGPVLSKILGILNVPSLLLGKVNLLEEGLPFDELTGSFSIENGLLTTEDLALKSPVIKLTAAGTYDLPTENLECMIAVSPFGAYSNLLKDIPMFGSLMQGERKGFLTALFEVKGPRTKPEVTYLPLESFTGGIKGLAQVPIDMLKNIITLPLPKKEKTEPVPFILQPSQRQKFSNTHQ